MSDIRENSSRRSAPNFSAGSLILSQDLTHLPSLEQHSSPKQLAIKKASELNLNTSFSEMELAELKTDNPRIKEPLSLELKLRERLYDKPENSGVMQFIRLQTLRKNQTSTDNNVAGTKSSLKTSSVLGHLPTDKSKRSTAALLNYSQPPGALSSQEVAALQNIVNRKRPKQITPTHSQAPDQSDKHGSIMEVEELGLTNTITRKGREEAVNLLPGAGQLDRNQVEPGLVRAVPSDLQQLGCGQAEVASDICPPLHQQQLRDSVDKDVPQSFPGRAASAQGKRSSDLRKVKPPLLSQSALQVAPKHGAGWEAEFFRKNEYDLQVPENTNAYEMLIEMRKKLGWVVDIPRHGPNTRQEMRKLKNFPDQEKEPGKFQEDSGEFFYCLPHNHASVRARYNPYDLQIVSANDARAEKMYFTISASYVTMCYQADEMNESNATAALWWMWERRLFYKVFHLPFFVKFRLWKAFKQWKKIIQRDRNQKQLEKLYRSLFLANEVLQGCLVHVHGLCESARNVFKDGDTSSIISLVDLDPTVTMTLQDFESLQKARSDRAVHQLNSLRERVLEVVWESCATVAEMEGITQGIREDRDNATDIEPRAGPDRNISWLKVQQTFQIGHLAKKKNEKTNRPLYVELAEWRKILARLSGFLRCIDYILQEFLCQLVFSAAQKLRDHLVASYNDQEDEDFTEESGDDDEYDDNIVGLVYTPLTSQSSRISRPATNSSRRVTPENKQKEKKVKKSPEPYVIPRYDFDKVAEVEGPPDVDKIMDEIKQRDIVEEVLQPVFTVSLVLNISSPTSSKSSQPGGQEAAKRPGGQQVKWTLADDHLPGQDSESGSEFESGDSEMDDGGDQFGDSEMDDGGHQLGDDGGRERDAYPRVGKEELAQQNLKTFVSLSPSAEEFRSSIRSLIGYFEDTAIKITPLLREPKLAVFYSSSKYDLHLNIDEEEAGEKLEMMPVWPDLDQVLRDDPVYQGILSETLDCVEMEANLLDKFASVSQQFCVEMEANLLDKFASNYEVFCQMVDQSRRNAHTEESIAKKPWTSEEFSQVLSTYTKMVRRMNKMLTSRRVAMVQVEATEFRDSCLPHPQLIVDTVNKCLPDVANKHNEELMTIIKGVSKLLDKTITSVEEFVEHLSFLGRISTELSALEKEHDVVNRLFAVARNYHILFQPEETALYQTLSPSFQHLKSTIVYCEAKKDENIRKFSSQLDTLISSIQSTLTDLRLRVHDPELLHADTHGLSALETIRLLQEEVQALAVKAHSYSSYQDRFGSSLSRQKKTFYGEVRSSEQKYESSIQDIQTDLSEIERDLNLRGHLWQSFEEWGKLISHWTMTSFVSIDVEGLQKNVNKLTQTVFMLEKGLPHNEVVPRLKDVVLDFKEGMPVITSLRNPALRQRHWEQIQKLINKTISHDKDFTLGNLLEMNIFKHKEKIQEIAIVASNEATLEQMLQKVIVLWQGTDFRLVAHAERDTLVIYGADDIMAQLEESQVTVGTIRGSRYVTPIKPQVEEWERKLQVFSRTLDEWLTCQRNWLYLEQIFSTPDIQRQLPAEYKLFMSVDKSWKDLMRRTAERPNALKSAITPGTLDTLQMCNTNLEKVQRCLEDYLETKRFIFPRFYFLSNDELLDILAQSKDPNAVQPHLVTCFDNIKQLDIQTLPRQPPTVRSMISAEKEIVAMPRNVRARGPIEQWLGTIETAMFETVKKHMKLCLADKHGTSLKDWLLQHPGQVVLTVTQIMFNNDVSKSLTSANPGLALRDTQDSMVDFLNQLASFTSAKLQVYQRMSIEALLTITVHNRDIVAGLVQQKVDKKEDFEWNRQLRYVWDEAGNNCQVLQSNALFQYGYEYLGCSARLVITPLTDRCYLTLTGALHLHLGGSPAGPAGTGKTETVKDLAKAMGKQCVVFNCSEGLDYKMLGKFFSGLAQSGSWCCFDEFNRIDVEVLSVVAMQIHTIKSAKDGQAPRFMFEGREIHLNPTCGYFITMNPTYAGRVELPDNLKYLFRPVAMMVPDYTLIAEVMLFSEGFTAAKSLSQKMVNLYQVASNQLSQQDHYDFGMRAIKSVLVMAGHGRSSALQKAPAGLRQITEEDESYILIHSLRDANMPKFLAEDVPLFESILDDLFPGVTPPSQDYDALEKAISLSSKELNLQPWPKQTDKVKQLYTQIMVRHGVMLVGPTGSGKTSVRNILQKALIFLPIMQSQAGEQLVQHDGRRQSLFSTSKVKKGRVETLTINPKCVTLGELYGETDPNTFEWADGLIGSATRKFSRDLTSNQNLLREDETAEKHDEPEQADTHKGTAPVAGTDVYGRDDDRDSSFNTEWRWLIFDGPVDTLWVENLNTVLDDSKVLCLASGERISLAAGMRLIFEVDNLSKASPATVSRCAMVYMDPIDLGWKPYVRTWLGQLPKDMPESGRKYLEAMFDASIDKGLNFLRKYKGQQVVQAPDLSIVGTLCHILSAYIDFIGSHGGFGAQDEKEKTRVASSDGQTSSRAGEEASASKLKRKQPKKSAKVNEETDSSKPDKQSKRQERKKLFLEKQPSQLCLLMGKLFVFAYTWSVGAVFNRREFMEEDDTKKAEVERVDMNNEFDNFARELFDVEPPLGVRLPSGNRSVYGYFVDMEAGSFVPWDVLIPSTRSLIEKGVVITIGKTLGVGSDKRRKEVKEAEIVPTVDIVRFSFLASLLLVNEHPVLLAGESGVGKTAIVDHMLRGLEKEGGASVEKSSTILGAVLQYSEKQSSLLENISSLVGQRVDDGDNMDMEMLLGAKTRQSGVASTMIQCSAQTTSKRLEAQLVLKLIKKNKTSMGAPKGRKVIVFVDDLNVPAPEEYGAQPPLELLRQFLELGGFYDTKKLTWKNILDVTIVAACGPPSGGRNPTTPRLLKHFSLLTLPQPSTKSLQHIYQVQLGRFLQEGEFMPEVQDCLFPLVSASIAIYYHVCATMLPTPAKSHYTFNIRDLSKVIQGMLQVHESVIVSKENCVQLFAHEATRIFHDRLTNAADRATFYQILSDNLRDYFKVRLTADKLMNESVLFGDFFDSSDTSSSSRVYRPLSDHNKLVRVLEEYHMRVNMGEITDQLVFFKDAVEHVVRAARVFRQPRGHLLLVGLDGTGKSTIIHLASYISNCELFYLKLHNQYGVPEFRDDLKTLYVQAGVKGTPTVFLLTDSDIVKESFLEDINCILNSGELPDLFDNEELDGITMELKGSANEAGLPDNKASVYTFFLQRIRQNLHVVLTMSPAGDRLRQRCRMNPALINCCTIDWFDEWSNEAMLKVARVFFANTEFIADKSLYNLEELKEQTAGICVSIHQSLGLMAQRFWEEARRSYYCTPSLYMELIRLYSRMLGEKKQEFIDNRNRLQNGLSALSNAYVMVGVMQEELVSLGPIIVTKAKETEDLLAQLEEDQRAVKEVEDIVSQEENIMARETQIVQEYANQCELDLTSVLPVLEDAISSLETLDKASISELRVYTNPPRLVATVVAAVCVLFQRKTDWAAGKLFLGDPQFLKLLLNYDCNNQTDKVFVKLKKFTQDPNFNPEAVGKVSLACKCICSWVLAIDNYNSVVKMVKPKQSKVQDAREALKLAQDSLAKKQDSLKKIENHLAMIQQQYQDSVNQREALKERQRVTGLRLDRASILISALADEEVRWSESVKILDRKLEGIVGDTLVAAASVAYLGAFTTHYRNELIQTWLGLCKNMNVPISRDFDLVRSLVDASQVMDWHNNGLPRDTLSTENATFVSWARKWPLFIDPQGQAVRWIRDKEGHQLKVVAGPDPNMMRTVEAAIKLGAPCLLTEVGEELNPALRPILVQETFTRGGQQIMKIGDVELEYNKNFRLYLATSVANPHYLPGVYLQVNIVNFTVTFDGLQEQLLSSVVKQERPMLEIQRTELLESISRDRQSLRDLEDKTLSMLQNTEDSFEGLAGHLLDDQDLVETLQQSKTMSQEIHVRVAQSEQTELSLNKARKRYLPVATRGSVIYFVVVELANLDVMYQYSLTWFQSMFSACISDTGAGRDNSSLSSNKSLASGVLRPASARIIKSMHNEALDQDCPKKEEGEGTGELREHLQNMIERLTFTIYRIVSVGLFSHHELIFSFLLCSSIMQANVKFPDETSNMEGISDNEWHFFLQGNVAATGLMDGLKQQTDGHGETTEEEHRQEQASPGDTTLPPPNKNSGKLSPTQQNAYPSWVTESSWQQCQYLESAMASFDGLCLSLSTSQQQWAEFKASGDPFALMDTVFVPGADVQVFQWVRLTKFQRLLLIKVLRLDVLPAAVTLFIQNQMGARYLSSSKFGLHQIYGESMARSPLIFILSSGCDPSSQLLRFARELKGSSLHLDMISLGRGQGAKAEELISKAQILKGRWVFLQNCHLAASWMPRLQNIVDKFNQPDDVSLDPQFRLWLSSMPDPSFPVSILQSGIKMTVEAPRGLKANLLRSFGSSSAGVVTSTLYDEGSTKSEWRPLLFGLCLFNSVVHERRKYGTLGWNIRYEFNDSDLEVSILNLQMLLEEHNEVPWTALNYLTSEVTYGGRVTDDWDRRCLKSLLGKFYTPAVFQSGFCYDSSHMYPAVPEALNFASVTSFVNELPHNDSPEVFGMTENAEKACRELQATDIINTVLSVQPRRSAAVLGSQKSSDTVVLELAENISQLLPRCVEGSSQSFDPALMEPTRSLRAILQKDVETKGLDRQKAQILETLTNELASNSALLTVLRQEIDLFNHLLNVVHTSVGQLALAVRGETVMSSQLDDAYQSLLSQRVPTLWKGAAYESRKSLSSWVSDLQQRVKFFADWAKLVSSSLEKSFRQVVRKEAESVAGATFVTEPRCFWLSAFFFPQGFLTAVLQNHARKMSISVDSLTFRFEVMKPTAMEEELGQDSGASVHAGIPPENGVLVRGLFLDGAQWDAQSQSLESSSTDQRFCSLPEILFEAVNQHRKVTSASSNGQMMDGKAQHADVQRSLVYECPLYRTSARAGKLSSTGHSTNFVTCVVLPSDKPPDFWILRGVAMLCQLDD